MGFGPRGLTQLRSRALVCSTALLRASRALVARAPASLVLTMADDSDDPELAEAIRRSLGQPERQINAQTDAEPAAKRRRLNPPTGRDDQTKRIYNAPTVVRTRSMYAPSTGGVSYPELVGDVRRRIRTV